jgi:NADPH-dependent 2,4-dienoyl-CoA reductase/sulfur reductase-like enzyme
MAGLKIVVVGGVAAGPKAAARARRLDPQAEITVLEGGEYISYSGCGLPFLISGEVPEVKSLLSTPAGAMRDAEFFRQVKDVNFLTGKEVTAIDRERQTVEVRDLCSGKEESYPYDKLVLATGALPVRPKLPGIDLGNVFVVRQPRRLGHQGLPHPAQIQSGGGYRRRPHRPGALGSLAGVGPGGHRHRGPGPGLPRQPGFRDGGHPAAPPGRQRGEGPHRGVVKPNVELARQAGLTIGPTGALQVDRYLRTSDPVIYAGGDCA